MSQPEPNTSEILLDRSIPLRERMVAYVEDLQNRITGALEELDGAGRFREDAWERPGGGGGHARVLQDGRVIEKGGVNISVVHGDLPEVVARSMEVTASRFFATGLSLVIHPLSPLIPTVHANFRYFELENGDGWFGGGIDLTPYVADEAEGRAFHTVLKDACSVGEPDAYRRYKEACDRYFWIAHRKEARGIGGLFYDYLRGDAAQMEKHFLFQQSIGNAFVPAYAPLVSAHADEAWTEREKAFQLLRRGRYVEFNLVYDRGTRFGLETDGRTESILMSLPPEVRWDYSAEMEVTESEKTLMSWLRSPREWV